MPIQLYGLHGNWSVTVWDEHMQIGCKFHSLADWFSFDDERINQMDRYALKWWRKNKDWLMALCIAHGRYRHEAKEEER